VQVVAVLDTAAGAAAAREARAPVEEATLLAAAMREVRVEASEEARRRPMMDAVHEPADADGADDDYDEGA